MVKRRIIRVLVPHLETMYFVERGQPRGKRVRGVQGLRGRDQQEARQSESQRRVLPDDAREDGNGSARGTRRHHRRRRDDHGRTREARRLRDSVHDKANQRDRGDRPAVAATVVLDDLAARKSSCASPRATGSTSSSSTPDSRRRGRRRSRCARARGPRRRGPARDAERGPLRHRRRRRLQAPDLDEDLPEDHVARPTWR